MISSRKRRILSTSTDEEEERKSQSSAEDQDVEMGKSSKSQDSQKPQEYKVNELINCNWHATMYKAKILSISGKGNDKVYKIHYQGWGKKFDEQITSEGAIGRFEKLDPGSATPKKRNGEGSSQPSKSPAKRSKQTPGKSSLSQSSKQTPGKSNLSQSSMSQGKRVSTAASEPAILIPPELVKILKKDGEIIEKKKKLPKLPASFTADKIVEEYKDNVREVGEDQDHRTVTTSRRLLTANTILELLDLSLYSTLLYQQEWKAHEILKKRKGVTFASRQHYGFVYLLRFSAKLEEIFDTLVIQNEVRELVRSHIPHFIKFLNNEREQYHDVEEDYK
jgi:hypothetical protein